MGIWSYVFRRENSSDPLLGRGPLLMAGEEIAFLSHEEVLARTLFCIRTVRLNRGKGSGEEQAE